MPPAPKEPTSARGRFYTLLAVCVLIVVFAMFQAEVSARGGEPMMLIVWLAVPAIVVIVAAAIWYDSRQ